MSKAEGQSGPVNPSSQGRPDYRNAESGIPRNRVVVEGSERRAAPADAPETQPIEPGRTTMPDTGIYSEMLVTNAVNSALDPIYPVWREWRALQEELVAVTHERRRIEASLPNWQRRSSRLKAAGRWDELEAIERDNGIRPLWDRAEEICEKQSPLIEAIERDRSGTPIAVAAQIDLGFSLSEDDFLSDYPQAAFCSVLCGIADRLPADMREALAPALTDDRRQARIKDLFHRGGHGAEEETTQPERHVPADEHDAPIDPILRKRAKRWRRVVRRTGTFFRMGPDGSMMWGAEAAVHLSSWRCEVLRECQAAVTDYSLFLEIARQTRANERFRSQQWGATASDLLALIGLAQGYHEGSAKGIRYRLMIFESSGISHITRMGNTEAIRWDSWGDDHPTLAKHFLKQIGATRPSGERRSAA